MTEKTHEAQGKESTPLELAESWLSYREAEVQRKLDETEASRRFTESYKMTIPNRPANLEPGGLDASDWDVAMGEYNQWPEEREETLGYLEAEEIRLDGEYGTIEENKERVKGGDLRLIEELAGYEKERREKLEKKRQATEEAQSLLAENRAGKEMDGVSETESVLQKLAELVNSGKVPEGVSGKNGWKLDRKWKERHDYQKNDSQIELELAFPEDGAISVEIVTYPGPILPDEEREKGRVDVGETIGFTLKGGKIYDWAKSKTERSFTYGYPDRHGRSSGETFDEADFKSARKAISELYSDLESLSSK